jgi:hypothetical protein
MEKGFFGKWDGFSKVELIAAYTRRRDHMLKEQATVEQFRSTRPLDADPFFPVSAKDVEAVAFWYSLESTCLPDCIRDGLESAVDAGGLRVVLLVFRSQRDYFTNIPGNVVVEEVDDFMSEYDFRKLMDAGVKLPILSDYIRMGRMAKSTFPFVPRLVSVGGVVCRQMFGKVVS